MSVFDLSSALVDAVAAASPVRATFWGVPGHDHRWDDLSPEGDAARAALFADFAARADALPAPTSDRERLATLVLRDFLRLEQDALAHHDSAVDLNILASPPQLMPMALDTMDTASAEGKAAAVARLHGLGAALAGYQRTLQAGLDRGQQVARRQVEAVVNQCEVQAGPESGLRALAERLGAPAAGDAAASAYASLGAWLTASYLPRSTPVDAFGPERYARAARRFVGAELDLAETYAWGWREVSTIFRHMQADAARIAQDLSVSEVLERLRTDPAFASEDPVSFLATMRAHQDIALALVADEFDIPEPLRTLTVQAAPPGGAPGAYYMPPSEDLTRPGAVWYSGLPSEGPVALFDQISTAYHEGFPGHHLQCGLQVALAEDLSRLHRVAYGYSGFAEGWALYAEQRMDELGAYTEPSWRLGMWSNQMARACRVVVDIGLHLELPIPADVQELLPGDTTLPPGGAWTFERAVHLMENYGGLTHARSESEVTRYLGWPGQAISYKVGQRAMLQLREDFRARHGDDLRTFHARVLATGNVALDALPGLVL